MNWGIHQVSLPWTLQSLQIGDPVLLGNVGMSVLWQYLQKP
jgi:hypothetical protein